MIQEDRKTIIPLAHNFKGGSQDVVFINCVIIDQNILSSNFASYFLRISLSTSYIPLTTMVVYHFEDYK